MRTYKVIVDGEEVFRDASRKRTQDEADRWAGVEYGHLQDVEVLDPEGFAVDRNGNRI